MHVKEIENITFICRQIANKDTFEGSRPKSVKRGVMFVNKHVATKNSRGKLEKEW